MRTEEIDNRVVRAKYARNQNNIYLSDVLFLILLEIFVVTNLCVRFVLQGASIDPGVNGSCLVNTHLIFVSFRRRVIKRRRRSEEKKTHSFIQAQTNRLVVVFAINYLICL